MVLTVETQTEVKMAHTNEEVGQPQGDTDRGRDGLRLTRRWHRLR